MFPPPDPPLAEFDCRLLRVAPLPDADEESALDVDMAELRYVGGSCGGATARGPLLTAPSSRNPPDPFKSSMVEGALSEGAVSDGSYPGGGKSSGEPLLLPPWCAPLVVDPSEGTTGGGGLRL